MRGPVPYVGGKSRLAQWIITHFPGHRIYVEVFGGGGHVLFQKPVSEKEVYNDLDGDVTNLMEVLRDRCGRLKRWLERTPYSEKLYRQYVAEWKDRVRWLRQGKGIKSQMKI